MVDSFNTFPSYKKRLHPKEASADVSLRLLSLHCFIITCNSVLVIWSIKFTFEHSSELFILPRVDDNIGAGVKYQKKMWSNTHVGCPEHWKYLILL